MPNLHMKFLCCGASGTRTWLLHDFHMCPCLQGHIADKHTKRRRSGHRSSSGSNSISTLCRDHAARGAQQSVLMHALNAYRHSGRPIVYMLTCVLALDKSKTCVHAFVPMQDIASRSTCVFCSVQKGADHDLESCLRSSIALFTYCMRFFSL